MPADPTLEQAFAEVEGVRLHFVESGAGRPLLLLPGWPQSWYAWRFVIPRLVQSGRRVVTLDPRGVGDSDKPADGYDIATVAREVRGFADKVGLLTDCPLDVVGHDLGVWIGFSLAADFPGDIAHLALLEAALPGVSPPPSGHPSEETNVKTGHFAFNRLDGLSELLLCGRERAYLEWLFRSKATRPEVFDAEALDEYARVNALPGATRAASAYYRSAFTPEALARNAERASPGLTLPVLAIGASKGVGSALADVLRPAANNLHGEVLEGCGHYLPEECPVEVARLLLEFLDRPSRALKGE